MNKIVLSTLTATLLAATALAQTSGQAQAGASASENTAVSANQSGAQAQSQSSAEAASQNSLSSKSGSQSAQVAGSTQSSSGSTIHATLVKPVDARKNKAGDEVVAKTTQDLQSNGEVIVPKGCKLIGHVTEAKARANGEAQSTMGIAFDHAILKDGREVPLSASIQALAGTQQSASAMMSDDQMMTDETVSSAGSAGATMAGRGVATGGGLVGGTGHAIGATGGSLVNTASSTPGGTLQGAGSSASATGALSSTSRGVVGMNGLQLSSVASNSTQGSLITSTQRNVHLDSGTQMILLVSGK